MENNIEQLLEKWNLLIEESKGIKENIRKELETNVKKQNTTSSVKWVGLFILGLLFGISFLTYAYTTNEHNEKENNKKIEQFNENKTFDIANKIVEPLNNQSVSENKTKNITFKNTYLKSSYSLLTQEEVNNHFTGYTTVIYPIRVKLERFLQDVEGQITEQGKIRLVSSGGMYIYRNGEKISETKNNEEYSFLQEEVNTNKYTFIAKNIYNPIEILTAKRFPKYLTDEKKQKGNNANKFRGILEFVYNENSKSVDIINELDIEQYIRGIGESASWTAFEKMKMQSILARSYAYFYMYSGFKKFKDADYILTDSPANSQKYMGAGVTNGENWQKAAKETIGEILVDKNGDLFIAPYSTCSYKQADGKVRRKTLSEAGWSEEKLTIDGVVKLKFGKDVLQPVDDTFGECKEKQSGGHGVGLSGNGAEHMASKLGKKALEIIQYYYQGVSIKNIF